MVAYSCPRGRWGCVKSHPRYAAFITTSSTAFGYSSIETINDQLKNVCQIEHTRHRSPVNFLTHLIAGLIAYARQPKKPSLNLATRAQAQAVIPQA